MQDSWKNAEIWVTDQLFAAGPALSRSIGILPKAMVGRGSTEAAIDKVSGVEKAVEFIHRNAAIRAKGSPGNLHNAKADVRAGIFGEVGH